MVTIAASGLDEFQVTAILSRLIQQLLRSYARV